LQATNLLNVIVNCCDSLKVNKRGNIQVIFGFAKLTEPIDIISIITGIGLVLFQRFCVHEQTVTDDGRGHVF
jgi:hypothetical protein